MPRCSEPDCELCRIAREIAEKYFGPAPFKIGDRVRHPSGRLVKITSGQYWADGGLSNFWDWREVLPDGSLSETRESGYGWRSEISGTA